MQNEQIVKYQAEIESLEKQLISLPKEMEGINQTLSKRNSEINLLKNDRDKTGTDLKAIGFFKFKEKKPLKEKLAVLNGDIKTGENEIAELNNKIISLTQQEKSLKDKLESVRLAKDKLQKEEELKERAEKGDPQAQFEVAKLYLEKRNSSLAAEWLNKAAAQGHEGAKKLIIQIEEDEKRILAASYDLTLW
jgi:TPR repeat protein